MTFYNHIENVRTMAINLTNGELWHGARDKARVFDSLDAARREYMQLQEENVKLWEEIEAAKHDLQVFSMGSVQLEVENAKLRELVRWMYDRMDESCAVQHPYAPAPIRYDHLMQALARARDLGVEVDE